MTGATGNIGRRVDHLIDLGANGIRPPTTNPAKAKTAGSVAAAIELFESQPFDLVMSDLGLPDGSGLDLIRQIHARRKVPAIALTGFGMEEDISRSREAGFDAHLTKPINFQKLEAALFKLLQEKP